MATFFTSERKKQKMVWEGFVYNLNKDPGKGRRYWICEEYFTSVKCVGRAITDGDNVVTVTKTHYGHAPSAVAVQAKQVRSKIQEVAGDPGNRNAPRTVVNECLAGTSDAAIAIHPKLTSLEQAVRRKRKFGGANEDIPNSLADVYFPDELRHTKTELEEDIVFADTGANDPQRIIILGSPTNLRRLLRCTTWLCDGTFHTSPNAFYQIDSVHGLYQRRVIPFLTCLLPNKTRATHEKLIQLILDRIDRIIEVDNIQYRPQTIIIDRLSRRVSNKLFAPRSLWLIFMVAGSIFVKLIGELFSAATCKQGMHRT
ncbi:hypothetical protein PPYR_09881 [Photinus pyralis]|uniref:FLYWCH-type domain-containing protein n=1 Tax=Photinus pyralis TaxID=7054 RepID=A0A5N4AER2_PHOPY|nr:hypothetical protein PPYR_09881 [Photinus pyralis]